MASSNRGGGPWTRSGNEMGDTNLTTLLSDVVDTTTQPFLVLNETFEVEHANAAFCETFQVGREETVDRRLYDLGNGQWDIFELHRLLEEIVPRDGQIVGYRVEHEFERIGRRVMLVNARRLVDSGERPPMILLAIDDATERETRENELIAEREFADKLIDSVREGLLVLTPDLVVEHANDSFYAMFQVDRSQTIDRYIYDLGNGQWDIPTLRELLEEVLPRQKAFDDVLVEHEFETLGTRIMKLNGRKLDHLPRILLAIRDVTESQRHEARQKVLLGELQHRVKNVLATVGSVARLLRRDSDGLDDFVSRFERRLASLARTQEMLLGDVNVKGDLATVVRTELEAHGASRPNDYDFEGPTVALDPRQTQAMGMILHELATNAAKYGALASEDRGRIDIGWSVSEDALPLVKFQWRECDVAMSEPAGRKGFGSEVLELAAPYELGGSASRVAQADGVAYTLTFPLNRQ